MAREATSITRPLQPSDRFKTFTIVMEGEKQEPNYFNVLNEFYTVQHRESRIQLKVVKRKPEEQSHSSPCYLIQYAQEFSAKFELQTYDELWIVFDADSWQSEALASLISWKKQASFHYLAYSNPCFELWLILHLVDYSQVKERIEATQSRKRSKECKQILNGLKQENKLSGEPIQYIAQIPQAIERAKALDIDPKQECPDHICTRVYQLVERLTTLPEKYDSFNIGNCHNEKEVETKFVANYLLPALGYSEGDWQQEVPDDGIRLDFILYDLVIETKRPSLDLIDSHVKQLENYLIAKNAHYGLLTNGKELRIYEQVNQFIKVIFRCFVKGIEHKIPQLSELVGKKALNPENKPLTYFTYRSPSQTKKEHDKMKVIGIYHNKGGVGKTTVSVNLAAAFRNMGKRVLLIDVDAQANATFAAGLIKFMFDQDDDLKDANVFHLLEDSEVGFIPDIRRQSRLFNEPEIDVIPSHITLIDKQPDLTRFASTRWRLLNKIQLVAEEYDIVIIDAPPSRDIYAELTLIAADYLIIPSDLKPFANQGLPNVRHFIKQADETRVGIGKEPLNVLGVLPSKILSNPKYLAHTFEQQKQHIINDYHFDVLNSRILDRKALADCFDKSVEVGELRVPDPKSIFMSEKNVECTREFYALANEVLEKIGVTQ